MEATEIRPHPFHHYGIAILRFFFEHPAPMRTDSPEFTDAIQQLASISNEERYLIKPGSTYTYFSDRIKWCVTFLVQGECLERVGKKLVQITPRGKEIYALLQDYQLTVFPFNLLIFTSRTYQKFHLANPDMYPVFTMDQIRQELQDEKKRAILLSRSKKGIKDVYAPLESKTEYKSLELPLSEEESDDSEDPVSRMETSYLRYSTSMKSLLRSELEKIDPEQFEKFVLDLLTHMGYGLDKSNTTTSFRKDRGIDGIIYEDILKLEKIAIQVKQVKDKISSSRIREFNGALSSGGFRKGIYITLSSFTTDAQEEVDRIKDKDIGLIDGDEMIDFMIDRKFGILIKKSLHIFEIDDDLFSRYEKK